MHALHGDPAAIWGLVGFGFAYGVFHAAGPGHGKAVIASYMMANDRALKRGVVLAFLAAMLQGIGGGGAGRRRGADLQRHRRRK